MAQIRMSALQGEQGRNLTMAQIRMSALTKGLPQHQAAAVMTAFDQGLAYVWGRQDADGSTEARDTTRSEQFAWAWAMHTRAFMLEEAYWKPNLQDAYENWRRNRVIDPQSLTCGRLYR